MEIFSSLILGSIVLYGLLGLVAGILAGLFGIGGGLVIVPVLALIFRNQGFDESIIMHLAIGTSLATIVITSISSMRAHHQRGSLDWSIFRQLSPGILLGTFFGSYLAAQTSTNGLQIFVGAFIVLVALQLIFNLSVNPHRALPNKYFVSIAGSFIGALSAMAGIGGGSLTVPYLVWHQVKITRAVGTSAACGLPIAAAGAISFMITGINNTTIELDYSTGYLYWPAIVGITSVSFFAAPIGARLAHNLPIANLKRLFAVLLLIMGSYQLLNG